MTYFSPHTAERRPRWHCTHFSGMLYGGTAAACSAPNGTRVRAMPGNGCAAFVREVGADDEPGPPVVVPATSSDQALAAARERATARVAASC